MTNTALLELAREIETEPLYDANLTRQAFDLVEVALPSVDKAMIKNGAVGGTDAVIMIIDDALPGWSLSMHGVAHDKNGNWVVTIRQSEVLDSDRYLGVGHGPKLSNVLIAAFLKVLAQNPKL